MAERAVTFSMFDLDVKLTLRESERESDLGRRIYFIQLNIAIQTDCTVILSRTVHSREQARAWKVTKKKSRQIFESRLSISIQWQIYIRDFNHSVSLAFSATNVNRFKFSITHSSNHRSRTSKQLKKFAQFVEIFTRYEFSTLKSSRNNSRATTSTALLIKNQNIKNILKSRSNVDLDKNRRRFERKLFSDRRIACIQYNFKSRNDMIARSHECNAVKIKRR